MYGTKNTITLAIRVTNDTTQNKKNITNNDTT